MFNNEDLDDVSMGVPFMRINDPETEYFIFRSPTEFCVFGLYMDGLFQSRYNAEMLYNPRTDGSGQMYGGWIIDRIHEAELLRFLNPLSDEFYADIAQAFDQNDDEDADSEDSTNESETDDDELIGGFDLSSSDTDSGISSGLSSSSGTDEFSDEDFDYGHIVIN